jgi:CRP-like cAMP-binding protein
MEVFKHIIRNIYPISDKSLDLLLPYVQKKNYHKKEYILNPGEIKHEIYFVSEGLVSMKYINNEEDIIIGIFLKNEYVPSSMNLIKVEENNYKYSLIAIKDSTLYVVCKDAIYQLFKQNREITYLFLIMADNLFIKSIKEIIFQKCYSSSDRYKLLQKEFSSSLNDIPIKDLASLLGIKDTSLSRIRKQFTYDKIPTTKKNKKST